MDAPTRTAAAPAPAAPGRRARVSRRAALLAADLVAIAACVAVVVDALVG